MTEYKVVARKTFSKEASFLENINKEARSGWKVISIGYSMDGAMVRAMLEYNSNNNY